MYGKAKCTNKNLLICRICLSSGHFFKSIYNVFNENSSYKMSEVIEEVMCEKLLQCSGDPQHLCQICYRDLEISFNLKLQFNQTQEVLKKRDKQSFEIKNSNSNYYVDDENEIRSNDSVINKYKIKKKYLNSLFDTRGNDLEVETIFLDIENDIKKSFELDLNKMSPQLNKNIKNEVEIDYINMYHDNSMDEKNFEVIDKNVHSDFLHDGFISKPNQLKLDEKPTLEVKHNIKQSEVKNNTFSEFNINNKGTDSSDDVKGFCCEEDLEIETIFLDIRNESKDDIQSDQNTTYIYENLNSDILKSEEIDYNSSKSSLVEDIKEKSLEYQKSNSNSDILDDLISKEKCHLCGKLFKNKVELQLHVLGKLETCLQKNKQKIAEIKVGSQFVKSSKNLGKDTSKICEICGRVSKNSHSAAYHKLLHKNKAFGCEHCKKKFVTNFQLQRHLASVHLKNKAFLCSTCGKFLYTLESYKYHQLTHLKEKKFSCSYCKKKFYQSGARNLHVLNHGGEKSFSCDVCDYTCFTAAILRRHTRSHTGEHRYSCKYCPKSTTTAYNMKVHLLSHQGPYACKFCNKRFADSDTLKFHVKKKHVDEKLVLDIDEKEEED